MTAVSHSPFGEPDLAVLLSLGLVEGKDFDPIGWLEISQFNDKDNLIQSRSKRVINSLVESYTEVSSDDMPSGVSFIDKDGNLRTASGLHRKLSRLARKETQVKSIVLRGEYEGLAADDPKIILLMSRLNARNGEREDDKEFLAERAVRLHLDTGMSVKDAAAEFSLKPHLVQSRVNHAKVILAAAKYGADTENLPHDAVAQIVKLKDATLVQAACKIPVAGVGPLVADFTHIVGRIRNIADKQGKALEIDKITQEYRSKHEEIFGLGIVPVKGESPGLGSVVRAGGKDMPDSPSDIAVKAKRKADSEMKKFLIPARNILTLDLAALIATPGASPKQKQDFTKALRELRNQLQDALDQQVAA